MVYILMVLLAQTAVPIDPISGASGWVGTGLLGSVLAWLLFIHIPNKDKQISNLIETRDNLVERVTSDFRQALFDIVAKSDLRDKERRDDFRESLQRITEHCEKEVKGNGEAIKREVDRIRMFVEELSKIITNLTQVKGE